MKVFYSVSIFAQRPACFQKKFKKYTLLTYKCIIYLLVQSPVNLMSFCNYRKQRKTLPLWQTGGCPEFSFILSTDDKKGRVGRFSVRFQLQLREHVFREHSTSVGWSSGLYGEKGHSLCSQDIPGHWGEDIKNQLQHRMPPSEQQRAGCCWEGKETSVIGLLNWVFGWCEDEWD